MITLQVADTGPRSPTQAEKDKLAAEEKEKEEKVKKEQEETAKEAEAKASDAQENGEQSLGGPEETKEVKDGECMTSGVSNDTVSHCADRYVATRKNARTPKGEGSDEVRRFRDPSLRRFSGLQG